MKKKKKPKQTRLEKFLYKQPECKRICNCKPVVLAMRIRTSAYIACTKCGTPRFASITLKRAREIQNETNIS